MGFQVPNSPTPRVPAHLGTWNSMGYWIPTLQLCKSTSCALVELEIKGPINSKSPTPQLPNSPRACALGDLELKGLLDSNFATLQVPTVLLWSWNLKGRLIPSPQLPNSPAHLGTWGVGELELSGASAFYPASTSQNQSAQHTCGQDRYNAQSHRKQSNRPGRNPTHCSN